MTELNLGALFHLGCIIVNDRIGQDVHHVKLVADGRNDMEATRVEGDCRGVLARWRLPCHFKLALVPIPYADVSGRTSHNELFAKADIHARDFLVVEGTLHVEGRAGLGIRPIKGQSGHQQLIVSVDVIEQIFVNCDEHLADRGRLELEILDRWPIPRVIIRLRLSRQVYLMLTLGAFEKLNYAASAAEDQTLRVGHDRVDPQPAGRLRHVKDEFSAHRTDENVSLRCSHN